MNDMLTSGRKLVLKSGEEPSRPAKRTAIATPLPKYPCCHTFVTPVSACLHNKNDVSGFK